MTYDARVPAAVRAPVQRFGAQLWQRITARFPALERLRAEVAGPPAARAATRAQIWQGPAPAADRETTVAGREVPALVRALRDPNAEAGASAAIALGACKDPELAPTCRAALREALLNADGFFHPLTRVAALQSLVRMLSAPPAPAELDPLLAVVRDIDAEVSMAAIDAIVTHAPANVAIDRLMPVLLDDSGFFLPVVRSAASRALERAGLLTTSASP